jgi:peptide/nickel transport system substrate-binding protein
LPPLPRHILGAALERDSNDQFGAEPFWTREFVGAGPFKMDKWEPGSFIEGVPFAGHVRGRPKIERMKLVFLSDADTALSNMLAGEVHLAADTVLRLEQVAILNREWGPRNLGEVLQHPNQWRAAFFQFRPDVVGNKALQDVRVRQALAYSVDRNAINEALYSGQGIFSDSMIAPTSEYGPAVQATATSYPYDPQRAEQAMAQAGYSKVGGFFTSPTEGRPQFEVKTNAAADNESELSILASGWRTVGFDMQQAVLPAAQAQDNQLRATYPGLYVNNTNLGDAALLGEASSAIPRAENRWTGANRGGWSNSDYDRIVAQYNTTLDRTQRTQQAAEMVRIFTADVGAITLFMRTQPWAHVAGLTGMAVVAPESTMTWDIANWEFR